MTRQFWKGLKYGLPISLIFWLMIFVAWANAAIYYVDSNADGDAGSGTSEAANVAWKTIAKVNASSFSAGDSILFKKGCTWREQLTVPSSGSSGSPITFGAYGTGANPIIDGSALIAPGTSWSPSGAWSDAKAVSAAAFDNQDIGANLNMRELIAADSSSYSGTKVRVTVKAHSISNTVITGMSIGVSTSDANFDANPTRITFSSNNSVTVTAGGTAVSDEITFSFDKTKRHLIQHYYLSGAKVCQESLGGNFEYINWSAGSDLTATQNMTSDMTAAVWKTILKVEVYNDVANVWQTAATTEPGAVFFDGVYGQEVVTLATARDWQWSANVLYVYAASDPDTLYTTPGIEGNTREFCIDGSDRGYITYQNLTLEKARTANIRVDKQTNGGNVIIDSITSNNAGRQGIQVDGQSAKINNVTVKDCTVTNYARDIGYKVWPGIHLDGSGGDNFTVQRNTITQPHVGNDTNQENNGIDVITGNNALIEHNVLDGTEHGIVMRGATSSEWVIRYNYVKNGTDDAFYLTTLNNSNGLTYYNIAEGGDDNCFDLYNSPDAGTIANNVCYNQAHWSFMCNTGGAKGTFKNNIVYKSVAAADSEGTDGNLFIYTDTPITSVYDNNLYYDSLGSLVGNNFAKIGGDASIPFSTWKSSTSQDAHSLNADPLLVNAVGSNFHLQSTSPCINAGTFVYGVHDQPGAADYDGVLFNSMFPYIGAYDYAPYTRPTQKGVNYSRVN